MTLEDREDPLSPTIHVGDPSLGGLLVVLTTPVPLPLNAKVAIKVLKHVVTGHDSATEEITPHPVGGAVLRKLVDGSPVTEHMNQQLAVVLEPAGDFRHQRFIIAHVLEHLERDDAIKGLVNGKVVEYAKNQAKWNAAKEWCLDRGYEFKVLTENELGIK